MVKTNDGNIFISGGIEAYQNGDALSTPIGYDDFWLLKIDVNGSFSISDIDECTFKIAKCPKNSKCVNKEGTYGCECNEGFEYLHNFCVGMAKNL